jgi:Uma2 family endonuclease
MRTWRAWLIDADGGCRPVKLRFGNEGRTRRCRMTALAQEVSLLELSERLAQELPGHRVEIMEGRLSVVPPADGSHAVALTLATEVLLRAGVRDAGLWVVQAVGVWLPTDDDDHVISDLAVVERDFRNALVKSNCYAPEVFRLVFEVTSTNWSMDLIDKVKAYAIAKIPVYVVADRERGEVLVFTDPSGNTYRTRSVYKPGETFPLPDVVGIRADLKVDEMLGQAD